MTDLEKLINVHKYGSAPTKENVIKAIEAGVKSTGLWGGEEGMAKYSFFVENNIANAKQHFYNCALIDEFEINYMDANILSYGINHIGYALLSDNQDLIDRYSKLTYSNYEKDIRSGRSTPAFIIQCLIKNDLDGFGQGIDIMRDKTVKNYPMQLDLDFYLALAERNKDLMESILMELVSPKIHKQRNKYMELINELVSHPAIGYAKLAWLKGIEVKVESSFIPAELLPVKPLNNYVNDYEFLKQFQFKA